MSLNEEPSVDPMGAICLAETIWYEPLVKDWYAEHWDEGIYEFRDRCIELSRYSDQAWRHVIGEEGDDLAFDCEFCPEWMGYWIKFDPELEYISERNAMKYAEWFREDLAGEKWWLKDWRQPMDIGDLCVFCGHDTSFGSGRFVNRIPAVTDACEGYACPDCMSRECDRCDEMISVDEDFTPYVVYGLATDRFDDGAYCVHEECLTPKERELYEKRVEENESE